ncbi:MAG: FHA domain-containing protein [Planctomycetes bacterium]|nr:FHA domain-containing protein [Planctomycetota bacterium]
MTLTLQILDAGETFFRTLDDVPIIVGAAADADVRLTEVGVAGQHARIEPLPDGGFRLVDLGTEVGTRVNGEDVVQVRLAVGDRIEVGSAVLVVGQRIELPRTAADVVRESSGPAVRPPVRRRRLDQPESRGRAKLWIGVVLIAMLAAVGGALHFGSDASVLPRGWGDLERAQREGRIDDARTLLERFRSDWAAGQPERVARLDAAAAHCEAVAAAIDSARERALTEALELNYPQQFEMLQSRMRGDRDEPRAIAARVVLRELDALRAEARRLAGPVGGPANPGAPGAAADARSGPAGPVADASHDSGDDSGHGAGGRVSEDTGGEPTDEFVRDQLARIREAADAGRYVEALEHLSIAMAATDARSAAPLRDARIAVESKMRTELDALIAGAQERAAERTLTGVDGALAMLRAEAPRFPSDGPFARIPGELRALEDYRERLATAPAGTAPVASPQPTATVRVSYKELAEALETARGLESDGDFVGAARLLRGIADSLRDIDPAYAADLDGRRQDLDQLAGFVGWLAEQTGLELSTQDGAALVVAGANDGRPVGPDGQRLQVLRLAPSALVEALERRDAPAAALTGAAILCYRGGERAAAERLLARALRSDQNLKPAIDGIVARGRGEPPDELGYRLVSGGFVAEREIRVDKRAKELERELTNLLRLPEERRAPRIDELLAKGPSELDALIVAMRHRAGELADQIAKDAFHRHVDRVAELRTQLDEARRQAKDLIFDEVRYFYPYRAPAVSGDKEAEYWKVQGEVDELVARVRELWDGESPSKRVPRALRDELGRLDWLLGMLRGFGESLPEVEQAVLWARVLPTGDEPLELKTFCWDEREVRAQRHARAVRALNAAMAEQMTRAEQAQVDITNAYREMFGHAPLAVNAKLVEATRGHAKEMSQLGYFSHFSPTPGRRTPFDRMKLAGYEWGASENIANHPSAQSAHEGWTHSSGHHRNLLSPGHTEFAVGNDGRYWVQNFGRGEEYRDNPVYRKAFDES